MKRCTKCNKLKPESDFYRHSGTKDGLYTRCKPCHNESVKKWKKKNREYINRLQRINYRKNKNILQQYRQEINEKHPEIKQAHTTVQIAIKQERLTRPEKCVKCKKGRRKILGHHESYDEDRWLDVTWLCYTCHDERHDQLDQGIKVPIEKFILQD